MFEAAVGAKRQGSAGWSHTGCDICTIITFNHSLLSSALSWCTLGEFPASVQRYKESLSDDLQQSHVSQKQSIGSYDLIIVELGLLTMDLQMFINFTNVFIRTMCVSSLSVYSPEMRKSISFARSTLKKKKNTRHAEQALNLQYMSSTVYPEFNEKQLITKAQLLLVWQWLSQLFST